MPVRITGAAASGGKYFVFVVDCLKKNKVIGKLTKHGLFTV